MTYEDLQAVSLDRIASALERIASAIETLAQDVTDRREREGGLADKYRALRIRQNELNAVLRANRGKSRADYDLDVLRESNDIDYAVSRFRRSFETTAD